MRVRMQNIGAENKEALTELHARQISLHAKRCNTSESEIARRAKAPIFRNLGYSGTGRVCLEYKGRESRIFFGVGQADFLLF